MKKSKKIIGLSAILALFVGVSLLWAFKKNLDTKLVHVDTTSAVVTTIPTATIIPASPTSASKYTAEFRAKARSAFIESCKLKVGQQYASACECGADYLATHYSDAQLEQAYIEYHSGNKIPSEVQAAYDACENK